MVPPAPNDRDRDRQYISASLANQTRWSTRTMAKAQGVDASTVRRIWQEHGLQAHRQETFKLPRDPQFVPKLLDLLGVYLNPPQDAVVLWTRKVIKLAPVAPLASHR
jgi:hypothetical protein